MLAESNPMKVLAFTTDQNAIVTGGGYYFGCRVTGDGTNLATAIVYDALTATGTIIDQQQSVAAGASTGSMQPFGQRFNTGLSVDVTTPGRVVVWYIPSGA